MGKKIQNYCLQQVIGQGQFGKVYKATNQKTQQIVAIKVIKIQKFKMSPKLQQFTINQIQTLSKIQDTSNIVKFIQILKTANNYYFVYQFCNGGTLQQQIKSQGFFSQEKALNYFKDLLKAFKMLIKNNIMHRDIKPSNILLHNANIKLADFGFCKPLKDSKDLAQTMLGSPIYMAPQILKGQIYTLKADIWSLGVVLYQMLFGYCPFEQKTIARLINLIDQGTVTFPNHIKISKKMQDLLNKMLVKDQFKRITWQEIFDYDFNQRTSCEFIRSSSSNSNNQKTFNPFSKKQHINKQLQKQDQKSKEKDKSKQKSRQFQKQSEINYYLTNLNKRKSSIERQKSKNNISKNDKQKSNKNDSFTKIPPKSQSNSQKQGLSLNSNYSNINNLNHQNSVSPRNYNNYNLNINKNNSAEGYYSVQPHHKNSIKNQSFSKQSNSNQNSNLSDQQTKNEKKKTKSLLDNRMNIYRGLKIVQKLLNQSTSKLTVYICCFLMKKISSYSKQLNQTATKIYNQKQNCLLGSQLKKIVNIIFQQKTQLNDKFLAFQNQLKLIIQPQDIVYLKYAQQQSLTQQKDGLIQLLQIDDYLNGVLDSYAKFTKKELLQEYQKRVLRKS